MSIENARKVLKLQLERGPALVLCFPRVPSTIAERLTESERDVVDSVARGSSNSEIAVERGTATQTVANQLYRIYQKLGVSSRAELVEQLAVA